MFFFLLGLILFFHRQEVVSQEKFSNTLLLQSNQQKCQKAYVRLLSKISIIEKSIRNQDMQLQVFMMYEAALKLSQKNEIKCLLLEQWGDDVWMAYKEGVKDGKKTFDGGL
jgi:hypothetical protein